MRVPTRMAAVLIIPLLAAIILAALRVNDSIDDAGQFDQAHRIAVLSQSGTDLMDQLQRERDLTIDTRAQAAAGKDGLQEQRRNTDASIKAFHDEAARIPHAQRFDRQMKAVQTELQDLPKLRAATGHLSSAMVSSGYTKMIMPILGVNNLVGIHMDKAHAQGWAKYTLSAATAMVWSERALLADAADAGKITQDQRGGLESALRLDDWASREFRLAAGDQDLKQYDDLMSRPAVKAAGDALQAVLTRQQSAFDQNTLPTNWYSDFTVKIEGLAHLERAVGDRLVNESAQLEHQADEKAWRDAGVALLLLVGALSLTALVSRSIVIGLRRLQTSAVEVSEVRLPAVMASLTAGRTDPDDLRIEPVASGSRDEIGEVGRAVDALHQAAVGLATSQARLRENVAAIFQNLAHRNQSLVQRQLRIITELEREELDSRQLERLFQLDHLATRMRRNSENLMVLAGADAGGRTAAPMGLLDIVRTAVSEVEQYERIVPRLRPGTAVTPGVSGDLVHLLAELLENATSFSSPLSEVTVSSQHLPDGRMLVEIRDLGIGMTQEQMDAANESLRLGPSIDISLSERLGLYVVGTLAHRHGIEVHLRPAAPAGVSALVILPLGLTVDETAPPAQHGGGHRAPRQALNGDVEPPRSVPAPTDAHRAPAPQPVRQPAPGAYAPTAADVPAAPQVFRPEPAADAQALVMAEQHVPSLPTDLPADIFRVTGTARAEQPGAYHDPADLDGLPADLPVRGGPGASGRPPQDDLPPLPVRGESAAAAPAFEARPADPLPQRAPAAGPRHGGGPPAEERPVDPERIRSRLSGFQQGAHRAAREQEAPRPESSHD
ncbi:nitrate- and nitrite sensing domain-containing protein [Streptomyces vinaceus]|uniref:nitrate- and nitrite sensing domain-containing protein n=1 Tax=Streptomyces vinaceus TaxID=1960 RepID=UPI0038309541